MRIPCALLTTALLAQASSPAQTTGLPGSAQVVQQTFGKGAQVYGCQASGGAPAWVFLAPAAILYELPPNSPNGPEQVATHSAGPVWQANDGSGLVGTTLQSTPSATPESIPQLLLSTQHFGTANGVFSTVSYITRTATTGGTAPAAGCDSTHIGTTASVPYTAIYTFYSVTK